MSDALRLKVGDRVRFLPRDQQWYLDRAYYRCKPGRVVVISDVFRNGMLRAIDRDSERQFIFEQSSVEPVRYKLEHNELFDVSLDTDDINTADYIDFRRYMELIPGVSSLCITFTRNLFEQKNFMELTHEVEGNHHTLMSESIPDEWFNEITGFELVDEAPPALPNPIIITIGETPSPNIIEKDSYYV